jgi:glycine cleavage system H lipoate-binding protein
LGCYKYIKAYDTIEVGMTVHKKGLFSEHKHFDMPNLGDFFKNADKQERAEAAKIAKDATHALEHGIKMNMGG